MLLPTYNTTLTVVIILEQKVDGTPVGTSDDLTRPGKGYSQVKAESENSLITSPGRCLYADNGLRWVPGQDVRLHV